MLLLHRLLRRSTVGDINIHQNKSNKEDLSLPKPEIPSKSGEISRKGRDLLRTKIYKQLATPSDDNKQLSNLDDVIDKILDVIKDHESDNGVTESHVSIDKF